MKKKDKPRVMSCLFVNFDDYKMFCEQINRPDLIYSKTRPYLTFQELKKSLLLKELLENFYE